MPIGKRLELLRWADEKPNRFVIEDDYDSELKFTGKPIPSLQGIDTAGKVAYIGTFSRSIAPSVRIAYLVLPPALLQRYQTLCSHYSPTVSRFEQHTLFQFMKGGHFERNINRNRNTYRKRRDAFVSALKASPIANQITIMGANLLARYLSLLFKESYSHGAYHSVRICTSHTRRITASCQFTGLYMENLVVASVFSFHKLQYTPFSACKYDICF